MPEEHARYNPSSLKLWELCPSYENRVDQESNPVAEMGSRVHEALEFGSAKNLKSDDEIELYELTAQVVSDILSEGNRPNKLGSEPDVINEVRLNIKLPHGDDTFGTCDKLVVSENGKYALAIDYKFGLMSVDDAEINAQVAAYTVGIFQEYSKLEELEFFLILPRQDEISFATFTREDSKKHLVRVSTIIRRAKEQGGKIFNPNHNLCEFCGAQSKCDALAEKALVIAKKYSAENNEPFPIPDIVTGDSHETPEKVAELLQLARLLKGWSDGVWAQARVLAFEEGWDIPGFKKIEVKTKRTISNTAAAFDLIGPGSEFNLSLDEFLKCCSGVAVGKLEDTIKEKAPRGEKAKRCEEAEDILRDSEVLTGGDSASSQLRVDRNYNK